MKDRLEYFYMIKPKDGQVKETTKHHPFIRDRKYKSSEIVVTDVIRCTRKELDQRFVDRTGLPANIYNPKNYSRVNCVKVSHPKIECFDCVGGSKENAQGITTSGNSTKVGETKVCHHQKQDVDIDVELVHALLPNAPTSLIRLELLLTGDLVETVMRIERILGQRALGT